MDDDAAAEGVAAVAALAACTDTAAACTDTRAAATVELLRWAVLACATPNTATDQKV
jgi:hypothetical protein